MSVTAVGLAHPGRVAKLALAAAGAAVAALVLTAAVVAALAATGTPAPAGVGPAALAGIPAAYLRLDEAAAATCPGLSWSVLAAIGDIESGFGTNNGPSSAGAVGPMQFEPASFAVYDHPVSADPAPNPPGTPVPPDITNPADAVYAAARLLCAAGAATDLSGAIYTYNHATWYVSEVETQAQIYLTHAAATDTAAVVATSAQAATAVAFAAAAIGTPYVWGGESPAGYDCSGLTQAAWAAAGIPIPRTSEAQWATLPHTSAPTPGDLVFYAEPGDTQPPPNHVGIYLGPGQMIDAPYPGTDIRVDPIDTPHLIGYAQP